MPKRLVRLALNAATVAGRSLTRLPGILAIVSAFWGTFTLWGLGWALLVLSALLIAVDRSIP